jgi:molybdate transport system substrate-binding protein
MKTKKILLSVVVLCCLSAVSVAAAEIHVSAAASMKDVLTDIIAVYQKAVPDAVILTNFGSSGALAKQAIQGAPTDLFISANPKWVDFLVSEGKGAAGTRRNLANNKLVFIGKEGETVGSLEDLKKLRRIALGSPASVPAGQYAEQAMRAAGVFEGLVKEKKLVMAQDVRQALLYADRGEVDGAFVYKTDALLTEHAAILLVVPEKLYDRITYPAILTATGAAREEVKAFYTYLGSDEARTFLQKYGFEISE